MKKNSVVFFLVAAVLTISQAASAMTIDWAGTYRFEYTEVDTTSLDSPKLRKSYFLNYLSLSPKIVAADGVNIIAKFNILPNPFYPDSQTGQPFGRVPTSSTGTSADDSAVASQRQGDTNLAVSQLYLNINQEFGAFVAGRAPVEFGLGMNHNAGNGEFDHWQDTLDMVGYKFVIGNFFMMPILGRSIDRSVAQGENSTDTIFHLQYNNPETESQIAVFHQSRSASQQANDVNPAAYSGTAVDGAWSTQHVNVLIARGFEKFKFKMEMGFDSGNTGIDRGGEEVELNGYGVAIEMDFPTESKWQWNVKTGLATGDNPETTTHEGYRFDRNYDVAFLMFNHPLGRYDVLRTGGHRPTDTRCTTPPCGSYATHESLDDESLSNAMYLSPTLLYKMSDRWNWKNTLTYAQLQTNPLSNVGIDVNKNLGFEWDTGLVYKPHEKITWVNELGLLFPGDAFKGGTNEFGKAFTYGFSSKAAISF